MLKLFVAGVAVAAMVAPAVALECPVEHAIYGQKGSEVSLHFAPVPQDGASNQIAAFEVFLPEIAARFIGAIHIPNGFGQPHGSVDQGCTGAEGEECEFWTGVVYASGADGIVEFPYDPDLPLENQMAPQQMLLPEFAVTVWYASFREAFSGDRNVLDVFTLAACAT